MSRLWSDSVDGIVRRGRVVSHLYNPRESVIRLLSEDTIYIKSDMDTDADGSPRATEIDPYGQLETSLSKWNGWKGDYDYVNSEIIPYVVLPKNFYSVCDVKCKLGDLALVRRKNQEVFAIYADQGPKDLIGEGSIKAVESLGGNPWNSDKTEIVSGIFGVEYIIFAQSTASLPVPSTFDEIQRMGEALFIQAFGSQLSVNFSMTPEEMKAKSGDDDIEVWDIMNTPGFITSTGLNLRRGIGTKSPIITTIPANTVVKTKVLCKPEESKVLNVGADHNGLWIKVAYQNQDGFVRASTRYLNPKWVEDTYVDDPSIYSSLPFLNGKERDKTLTEEKGRYFYEHGIVPLCNNEEKFRKAIKEGYEEVPWARSAPCATTTSAVLEYAFRDAGMPEISTLFNNHDEYGPTHNVEIMLYRLGFSYWLKNTWRSQKGAIGLMAGRYTWRGTPRHSGHIYTIFSEIDEKYDLIGDNTGFNHRYRGPGNEAGTEGFWLPPGVIPERR